MWDERLARLKGLAEADEDAGANQHGKRGQCDGEHPG